MASLNGPCIFNLVCKKKKKNSSFGLQCMLVNTHMCSLFKAPTYNLQAFKDTMKSS